MITETDVDSGVLRVAEGICGELSARSFGRELIAWAVFSLIGSSIGRSFPLSSSMTKAGASLESPWSIDSDSATSF